MLAVSQQVYSDPSHDIIGRTAIGDPTMSVTSGGGSLHMEMAGPNPLAPGSPDADTKLDISLKVSPGQACFTGHLHGDAFPNAEVFVVNSKRPGDHVAHISNDWGQGDRAPAFPAF